MKKNVITIVSIVFVLIVCFSWLFLTKVAKPEDSLVVGMMSGWAPFMTINDQGNFEGFDVDVAQIIAQKMDKKLVIKDLGSLAPTFIALQQGKIDMIMSGLDITQARLQKMAMIPYTGADVREFMLLFWKEIPAGITSIEDLAKRGAVVCVEPGSGQEKFLDSIKGVSQKSLSRVEEMVLDIKFGKSTAMLIEPRVAARIMRLNPELRKMAVALSAEFMTFGCGIAVTKENKQLIDQVTSIINSFKADGTLKALEAKWKLEE